MVRSKVNIKNFSRRLVFENTRCRAVLLGCSPDMYNFVQWYDADTKANCAEGGANCVFKRFDAGGSSNGRIKERTENTECFVSATASWTAFSFSDKTCTVTDGTCQIDRFDNCGLYVEENGQSMGVLPSSYFRNSTTNSRLFEIYRNDSSFLFQC